MLKVKLQQAITASIAEKFPGQAVDPILTVPANESFGDFATNVAMVLAKPLKQNPRKIAEELKAVLQSKVDFLESVSIDGPGFINFRLKPGSWTSELEQITREKNAFGVSSERKGKRAMVEFVSANPTGPLHIGHGRNAVVGDTLANLLKAVGYDVVKEYYVNDGGIQITTLGKSVYLRYKALQGEQVEFPENCYQGEYIVSRAQKMVERRSEFDGWSEEKIIQFFGRWAGDEILDEIRADLKNIQVVFDTTFYESTLYKKKMVDEVLGELKEKNLCYEKDGALWLASTTFGDDKDRVLIKNDGTFTYLTPDIAYHCHKYKQGYDLMVNIWGADHGGYVPRLKAALTGLGYDNEKLHVILIQMVNLIRGGELVSMSTRKATYETLENVVKEVGSDVARYFFMMRSYQSQLDFDLELAKKETSENPVYYIQYAHARICSVFEKARTEGIITGDEVPFDPEFISLLTLPEEGRLARVLLEYPETILKASVELAAHRVAFYVLELAREYQSYYDKARGDDRYRVLTEDKKRSRAKLFLMGCVRQVLQNGLTILGISAPNKM